MYPSTQVHPLLSEAGLIPAKLMLESRRKAYAYRLLTLPDHHLTKHILPISLGEGDESSQSWEQPEDTLTWVKSVKPKLFGHLLAQQVASNHAIDPADGAEPVQSFGPDVRGCVNVIIEGKKKALEEAKKYRAGYVFWVDGSKLSRGNAGAAMCWKGKERDGWKNSSIFLGKNKEIIDAELWAIAIGLGTAEKVILYSHQTAITIFSDSREALTTLCQLSSRTRTPYLEI